MQENNIKEGLIFIFDFNTTNPLGLEWALILSKVNKNIIYVYSCNRLNTDWAASQITSVNWKSFQSAKFANNSGKILFLPWLPPRNQILRMVKVLFQLKKIKILWLDHNPIYSRSNRGILIWFLRKIKTVNIRRVVHRGVKDNYFSKNTLDILHPIFFNYSSNFNLPDRVSKLTPNVLYFGRICKQKGAEYLPYFLSKLDEFLMVRNYRIKFSIVGTVDQKGRWILDLISTLKLLFIELEIIADEKNVNEKHLMEKLNYCDLIFAPYTQLTESGTAALAISQFKPVFFVGRYAPFSLQLEEVRNFVIVAKNNDEIYSIFFESLMRSYQKLSGETIQSLQARYILSFEQALDKAGFDC